MQLVALTTSPNVQPFVAELEETISSCLSSALSSAFSVQLGFGGTPHVYEIAHSCISQKISNWITVSSRTYQLGFEGHRIGKDQMVVVVEIRLLGLGLKESYHDEIISGVAESIYAYFKCKDLEPSLILLMDDGDAYTVPDKFDGATLPAAITEALNLAISSRLAYWALGQAL